MQLLKTTYRLIALKLAKLSCICQDCRGFLRTQEALPGLSCICIFFPTRSWTKLINAKFLSAHNSTVKQREIAVYEIRSCTAHCRHFITQLRVFDTFDTIDMRISSSNHMCISNTKIAPWGYDTCRISAAQGMTCFIRATGGRTSSSQCTRGTEKCISCGKKLERKCNFFE